MKSTSAELRAHMAAEGATLAQCLRVQLESGDVLRFCDHDQDITISGWVAPDDILNGKYLSTSAFFATDVQTSGSLAVDNTEIHGPQVTPAIIESELLAGKWDRARYRLFLVNWADLTMGRHYLRSGRVGEVDTTAFKTNAGGFKAEIRGLAQAYTNTLCELTSPTCRAVFGDARCKIDLAGVSVDSTITGASDDGLTLYDTARTEPGPSTGVAITGITNANPGVVTMADDSLALKDGQAVTISGVVGPALLNTTTLVHNPSGATFELGVDTSDTSVYPPWTSGGTVTPLGGASGQFTGGVITFTTGDNAGLSFEVKSYVPGQMTLQEPPPYPVQAGDGYTMSAGCDKTLETCRDRFNNLVNFRAEPYIGGVDKLVQVGRHAG